MEHIIKVKTKFGTRQVNMKSKEDTIKCIMENFGFNRKFTIKEILETFQKDTFYSHISRGGVRNRLTLLSNYGYLNVKSVKRIKEGGKPTRYYTLTAKSYAKFKRRMHKKVKW